MGLASRGDAGPVFVLPDGGVKVAQEEKDF